MRRLLPLLLVLTVAGLVYWSVEGGRPEPEPAAGHAKSGGAARLDATASVPVVAAEPVREDSAGGGAGRPAERGHDPRRVIAADWAEDLFVEHTAFRVWTERHGAAGPAERAALTGEGVRLARERSAVLAEWIRLDPETALAAAVPMAVRAELPEAVVAMLEERVNGRGELSLNVVGPVAGRELPAEREFRSALIDGREYRAHVYGRLAGQATLSDTPISGIAVGRWLAVADSPVRLLEPGESPPAGAATVDACAACAALAGARDPGPGRVAYQAGGRYGVAADQSHFEEDATKLEAQANDLTEADNQPGSVGVAGRPSRSWTHGVKTVLLIRVDFSDLNGAPVGEAEAADLFNRTDGVGDFYRRASFNKAGVRVRPAVGGDSPDVTGVLRLPRTAASYAAAGDNASLHADARAAAVAAGVAVSDYDRVGVVFASLADLPGSKISYGGLGDIIGPKFWINGAYNFRVVAHELGHTFGLRHSNLWLVDDGDPVSPAGVSLEYGDPFDIMGGGADYSSEGDFSHWNKSLLQWIPDTSVTVVESGGVYRVHRFDAQAADLALPRALKVPREVGRDYWIGYRRASDDAELDNGAYVLWGHDENLPGQLLDLNTPGASPADAPLAVGATFEDSAGGVTLRVVGQGGSGADEWLEVEVSFRPRLSWEVTALLVDEQRGVARLTVRRLSNPVGVVSVAYSTENGTATAGVDFVAAAGVLTWDSGDMADKTIEISLTADALVEGVETFGVRLGAVSGGVRVGDALATVSIADAGARDTTFLANFINSVAECVVALPDGGLLAGGHFTLAQTAGFEVFDRGGVIRLDASGALVQAFDPGAGFTPAPVRALAWQPDGKILAAGSFTNFLGAPVGRVARLSPDGSLDTTFNAGAGANDRVVAMALQPDGRVVVGGYFTQVGGANSRLVARMLPGGALDPGFTAPAFGTGQGWRVESIALQPDGKILVGGSFFRSGSPSRSGLARLLPDGGFDPDFSGVQQGSHEAGSPQSVRSILAIAVQPDGRILIGGGFTAYNNTTRSRFARLTADGALEAGFAPSFNGTVNAIRVQPDGGVLVGGNFTAVNGLPAGGLARIRADGTVDEGFLATGGSQGEINDLALTADGRLLIAGAITALQNSPRERPIWRVLPGLAESGGVVEFAADVQAAGEGETARIVVKRTGGAAGVLRVGYATAINGPGDTALAGADYTAASGVLEWAAGDDAPKTIEIPVLADAVEDDDETFTVRLGAMSGGGSLGARRETVVQIGVLQVQGQTIVFPNIDNRTFGDAPFDPGAVATSGLAVAYEIVAGPAVILNGRVAPTGAGVVTVRALQPGNAAFFAAAPVERSFTVAVLAQTLTFPPIDRRSLGAGAFALAATSSAGLPVAFELVSGPATLAGATLTPTGTGAVTVRAVQAGDLNVLPAAPVERTFTITAGAGVLLSGLTQTYAAAQRTVSVITEPAGLPVVVTYAGQATPPTQVGSYPVVATVNDPDYTGSATGTLVINKAPLVVRPEPMQKILNAPLPAPRLLYEGLLGTDTPAVIDVRPVATSTATAKSKLGSYPIRLSGGSDDNYALILQDGTLQVVSVAASFETLLHPGADAVGASSAPIGLLRITVTAAQTTFTGLLELGAETAAISLSGKVASPSGEPAGLAGSASIIRRPKGLPAYTYRVAVRPVGEELLAEVYRNEVLVASGAGPRLLPASPVTRRAFAGRFTQRLFDYASTDADPALRPLPFGSATAVGAVGITGVLTFTGRHADGRPWSGSATTSAALDGDYRFFSRTYGARADTYVAGELSVTRAGAADPTAPTGRVVWVKSPKLPTVKTENYPLGYAARGYSELRRWIPPSAPQGALRVSHAGVELGQRSSVLPTDIEWAVKNVIKVVAPLPNVANWRLVVTPATGALTGSFVLRDAIPVPGRPDRFVNRTVSFAGALRSPDPLAGGADAPLGSATFMLTPLVTGQPILSGELTIQRP